MHSQDWVLTALHQRHTDGVTLMEYNFLLLFAPVGLIQRSRTLKSIECFPPFVSVYFFSFKNPYSSVYLQECIAAVLKAHTSLLLTNWACLAVVSLLTAGQITHMHTPSLSLAPSLFLTHTHTLTHKYCCWSALFTSMFCLVAPIFWAGASKKERWWLVEEKAEEGQGICVVTVK